MDRVASPKILQEIILDKLPLDIALRYAVLLSKTILVQKYIDEGADVMQEIKGTRIRLLYLPLRQKSYDITKAFIRADGNVHFQDPNTLHLVSQMESIDIVKALIKARADVNVQNENGKSAPHLAIELENSACVIALTEADADVNLQDICGYTPLHQASGSDIVTIIETLIKPGSVIKKQSFNEYFGGRRAALHIACGSILVRNVETLIEAGADVNLMDSYGRSALHYALPDLREYSPYFEAKAFKTVIISIVEDICRRLGEKDELLTNTVILSGSVAENTKIGLPDEFDFLCVLDKLPELFYIEESIDNNYMNVKLKKEYRGTACSRFFRNYSGFSFWQRGLLDRFRDVLQEILQMSDIYKHPNIFNVKYGVKEPNRSPNFALTFKWSCCKYKNMTVKIDLVPACQISCSPGSKFYSKTFNPDTNENKGVLIMFQNVPIRDGSSTRSDTYEEKIRTSAVNVERKLLNTFRQEGKAAYVIAKILCSDRVCPSVQNVIHVRGRWEQIPTCASIISSYVLKNCLFHVAKGESMETSRLTVHGYVCRIFQKLLQCSLERNLPCYMFPWQNLFTFQSPDTEHETSIKCTTRAIYAKIILNMLGKNEYFSHSSPEKIGNVSPIMNPTDQRDDNICANCNKSPGQNGINLKTCSRCKLWTYCSVKCQKENRKRHKRACDYHYSLRQSASDQL